MITELKILLSIVILCYTLAIIAGWISVLEYIKFCKEQYQNILNEDDLSSTDANIRRAFVMCSISGSIGLIFYVLLS